jgi:hypothetical protein
MPNSRIRALRAEIGALAADARLEARGAFLNKWGAWSLTLGTAYHKITPFCEPADPLYARFEPNNWACETQAPDVTSV